MGAMQNAESPAHFIAALEGWQKPLVTRLRRAIRAAGALDEQIKWGNLLFLSNGPVCVLRAEPARVLFGFWRGQRLREQEPRLKPGGKYEMATITLREADALSAAQATKLVKAAMALNRKLGDPTAKTVVPAPRRKSTAAKPRSRR